MATREIFIEKNETFEIPEAEEDIFLQYTVQHLFFQDMFHYIIVSIVLFLISVTISQKFDIFYNIFIVIPLLRQKIGIHQPSRIYKFTFQGQQSFKCGICEEMFTSVELLDKHSLIHEEKHKMGSTSYRCGFCLRVFITQVVRRCSSSCV